MLSSVVTGACRGLTTSVEFSVKAGVGLFIFEGSGFGSLAEAYFWAFGPLALGVIYFLVILVKTKQD